MIDLADLTATVRIKHQTLTRKPSACIRAWLGMCTSRVYLLPPGLECCNLNPPWQQKNAMGTINMHIFTIDGAHGMIPLPQNTISALDSPGPGLRPGPRNAKRILYLSVETYCEFRRFLYVYVYLPMALYLSTGKWA